jgi:aspartyl protease family protein
VSTGGGDPWSRSHAPRPPGYGRRLLIIIAVAGGVVLLISYLAPPAQWSDHRQLYFLRFALVLALIVPGLAASRQRLSSMALQFVVWIGIMMVLVAGYSYRFELNALGSRVLAELVPSRGTIADAETVSFRRAADGHFWIDAEVDGLPLHFLVDTGASGVVLTRVDARRLGYRIEALSFDQVFSTANGSTRGAPIHLDHISIGPIVLRDVPAWVNEGELGESLLGIGLLQRLSVEMQNDRLTIRR